jgi:predicted GIY-YIG superfamily endonuclease
MSELGTVTFTGKSGDQYTFKYYDFSGSWNEVAGVYIVARYNQASNKIYAIYVGETDNLKERMSNHHKQDCFDKNKANILCWLGMANQQSRLKAETDLIRGLNTPCND